MPEPSQPPNPLTLVLARAQDGDGQALEELLPLVYPALQDLARAIFRDQNRSHTLQPTALVHEAYLKLMGSLEGIDGKHHFFMVAGKAMRQILTDHARAKGTHKRGGNLHKITLHPEMASTDGGDAAMELLALDDSMSRLERVNERHAQVLEMRLFGGLTVQETAQALGISARSVDTAWALGRVWLRKDLEAAE